MHSPGATRRQFVKAAAASLAAPAFVPDHALGKKDRPAPSERIHLASIGFGMRGPNNTRSFLREKDCQVVAVCDIDDKHRQKGVKTVDDHYGDKSCDSVYDYRDLVSRADVDAVMTALPDNWHALVAVAAAEAGKDIYGEKPLAQTVHEGRAIVDAVKANDRIWQTGSQQRSRFHFRRGAELVRNGYLGKIKKVKVGLPSGHNDFAGTKDQRKPTEPPDHVHYERWLGPASRKPYIKARHHRNWRWDYNIGGGQLMDWIGHHCDIAHWGLGDDAAIGPLEVQGEGEFPPVDAVWNTATSFRIRCKYPDDVEVVIASNDHDGVRMGTEWIGEKGSIYVNRGDTFEAPEKKWRDPEMDVGKIKLHASPGHHRDFLDAVKSRGATVAPAEVGHRSITPGHLGHISMVLGRKIRWDPSTERIQGDATASRLLGRPMRSPWEL